MTAVNWKQLSWWVGVLVLLASLATPELAAGQASVSAKISESFAFNGETFRPGTLTVREVSQYNPNTTLNEIWVDGRCWGLILADVARASTPESEDRILFERDASGRLVLVGFAYRGRPAREFYGYHELATGGRWSLPTRSSKGVAVASQ